MLSRYSVLVMALLTRTQEPTKGRPCQSHWWFIGRLQAVLGMTRSKHMVSKPKLMRICHTFASNYTTKHQSLLTSALLITEMLKALKGQIPALLRHPSGAAVVDAAFTAASAEQRNAMAVEFYGRELSLFAVGAIYETPPGGAVCVTSLRSTCQR